VSRRLPGGVRADLATLQGLDKAVEGADKVISCAHAQYTEVILKACPPGTPVVLIGSTWRFSQVPNPAADQVRAGVSVKRKSRGNAAFNDDLRRPSTKERTTLTLGAEAVSNRPDSGRRTAGGSPYLC